MVTKTELNAIYRIEAINTQHTVVAYNFDINMENGRDEKTR